MKLDWWVYLWVIGTAVQFTQDIYFGIIMTCATILIALQNAYINDVCQEKAE